MKKLVIISGGLGILGQSYAKALIEDGFEVLVLDVTKPSDDCAGEFFACDIAAADSVSQLSNFLKNKGAAVYGLINNASCQPEGFTNELEDYSPETFRKVLDVNLTGSFLLTKAVMGFMKKNRSGSIINIGSIQGVVAPTFEIYEGTNITSPLVYAVAKAGLIHFSKWVAARYGSYNIRCNSVSPGGVCDHQKGTNDFVKTYCSKTPLNRMVHSSEVAETVRFLMSDKSQYITGQNILVDGGWTIH